MSRLCRHAHELLSSQWGAFESLKNTNLRKYPRKWSILTKFDTFDVSFGWIQRKRFAPYYRSAVFSSISISIIPCELWTSFPPFFFEAFYRGTNWLPSRVRTLNLNQWETEIQWIFTESQRLSLIQIQSTVIVVDILTEWNAAIWTLMTRFVQYCPILAHGAVLCIPCKYILNKEFFFISKFVYVPLSLLG